MKLLVNGSPQSGSYIAHLWEKAFAHFHVVDQTPKNALIFGIGGGTVMSLLSGDFPGINQTCVDVDEVIITIAKKYFNLCSIPNLSIVHADANAYMKQLGKKKNKYDCIIIDIFIGGSIPEFVQKQEFLESAHKILSPKGFLCMNFLREAGYQEKSEGVYTLLRSLFSLTKDYKIARNRFFYARK